MTNVESLLREWGGDDAVILVAPLAALVRDATYVRKKALEIEAVARVAAVGWPLRRLAALMLESALVRIVSGDRKERRFWTDRLTMTDPAELRREGFAARGPIEMQLWRRLDRLRRIHRLLADARRSDAALRDYLHASEQECRITLARYLFGLDDVIARIERDVRRSEGIPDHSEFGQFRGERDHAMGALPAMEQAIVRHLARDSVIRWASPSTPSAIDSLTAQPIGTVVLTIRPPGSTHEIQIKRAGRARPLPLDVVWKRNGHVVSSAHHLDGGSELNSVAYEAESAAFFSRIFREVHGFDAAMSRALSVARVDTIPTTNGDADLMEYFNTGPVFGDRFYEMRWNLYHAVRSLAEGRLFAGDDHALTCEFIRRTKPAQSILIGTTALRLDRLHRYLGPNGADDYFGAGRAAPHGPDDDRRFADQLLDEILGVYEPPRAAWRSYRRHVESAFRVPKNRARADRVYVSLLEQTGRFWGTLLAVRGYSRGESFVERNVGLRSVWADGQWQVRIVFMDHDSLAFGTQDTKIFRPRVPLLGAIMDADHILGGMLTEARRERGDVGCLREIYRVAAPVHRRGMAALRTATKSAYDRTLNAVRTKPALAALFPQALVPRMGDWDEAVKGYLRAKTKAAQERWSTAVQAMLLVRGYDAAAIAEHVEIIRSEGWFLRRLAFLYGRPQSPGKAATTSSITSAPAGRSTPPNAVRAGQAVMPRPGSQSA
jgi:hypothetical protein